MFNINFHPAHTCAHMCAHTCEHVTVETDTQHTHIYMNKINLELFSLSMAVFGCQLCHLLTGRVTF